VLTRCKTEVRRQKTEVRRRNAGFCRITAINTMTYLQPVFPFVLLLALVQTIRYRRSLGSPAFRVLALVVVAIFLVSWEPAAWLLSRCLEGRYPPRAYPAGDAQAIVVLASAVYPPSPPMPAPRAGADTYERCQYAARLFGSGPFGFGGRAVLPAAGFQPALAA